MRVEVQSGCGGVGVGKTQRLNLTSLIKPHSHAIETGQGGSGTHRSYPLVCSPQIRLPREKELSVERKGAAHPKARHTEEKADGRPKSCKAPSKMMMRSRVMSSHCHSSGQGIFLSCLQGWGKGSQMQAGNH